jgi:ketosteroid isomerase-like protein
LSDLDEFKQRYRRSLEAFIQGDPQPQKSLWSRSEDVTLANPLGPPAKGADEVFKATDSAAAALREGADLTYEVISAYETADLAYERALQGARMKLGDSPDLVPVMLRVTSIYRREDDGWKVVHRHADPITQGRPPESMVQSPGGPATSWSPPAATALRLAVRIGRVGDVRRGGEGPGRTAG